SNPKGRNEPQLPRMCRESKTLSRRILTLETWEESPELCARIATMNGGARLCRALTSQRQKLGLDGVSPHPVHGKVGGKDRPPADFTGDFNRTVMCSHNRFHQTESQTQTFLVPAFVAAVKAVPDSWKVFSGNAHPGIFHRDGC